VSER
jgi:hypothetical protein